VSFCRTLQKNTEVPARRFPLVSNKVDPNGLILIQMVPENTDFKYG
jgi:hypothetical protein